MRRTWLRAGRGPWMLPGAGVVGWPGCVAILWTTGWVIGAHTQARAARGKNVLIIAVDTLRWDAVSLHSPHEYIRDLTPNLRRLLAPRAVEFRNAYSQAPWTLPAFASMFTGLYPEQHGAEDVYRRLEPEQLPLAEILRDNGYVTMAVVSGHFLTAEVGLAQGFTMHDQSQALNGMVITAQHVTDRAIQLLADNRDRPFFLFVHYFDPHYVYRDHPEFSFATQGRPLEVLGWAQQAFFGRFRANLVPPARQAELRALYDEEVAYTDLHIGRLLDFLTEAGLWDSTCVIFVADHGEEFLDHGSAGHAETLFQELIHVTLLIADPSRPAPAVVNRRVETRWLFPTILNIVRADPPSGPASSSDLFAPCENGEYWVRSSTRPQPLSTLREGSVAGIWLSCLVSDRY